MSDFHDSHDAPQVGAIFWPAAMVAFWTIVFGVFFLGFTERLADVAGAARAWVIG